MKTPEIKVDKKGNITIYPFVEKKKNGDIIIHMPNLPLITKTIKEHGKRNI